MRENRTSCTRFVYNLRKGRPPRNHNMASVRPPTLQEVEFRKRVSVCAESILCFCTAPEVTEFTPSLQDINLGRFVKLQWKSLGHNSAQAYESEFSWVEKDILDITPSPKNQELPQHCNFSYSKLCSQSNQSDVCPVYTANWGSSPLNTMELTSEETCRIRLHSRFQSLP